MKSCVLTVLLSVLVLSTSIVESRQTRALRRAFSDSWNFVKSTGGDNVVSASSKVKAVDGTASARVTATSETITRVKNSVAIAASDAIAQLRSGEGTAEALAEAVADSTAEAVAQAFTSVLIEVESDGEGNQACGSGYASAEAAATTYAVAISDALAIAADENNVAMGEADSEAIASATAQAFAKSQSIACVNGKGAAYTHQKSFAKSIAKPYAKTIAAAFATVTADGANAVVRSDAESGVKEENTATQDNKSKVTGNGFTGSRGASGAGVTQHPSCEGTPFERCCSGPPFADTCDCSSIFSFGNECSATLDSSHGNSAIYVNDAEYSPGFFRPSYPAGFRCLC